MELKLADVRPISEEDPLALFHASNKSPETDKEYTQKLRMFLGKVMNEVLHGTFEERAREFVEIGRNKPERMMGILLGLSRIMRERTKKDKKDSDYLNPSAIPNYFSSLKGLLNANDVPVNWARVDGSFPELDNVNETQGWTRGEIRLMAEHATNPRDKAIILTIASSGMRRAGLLLRWGDLTRIYDVGGRMVKEEDLEGRVPGEPACVAVAVYRRSVYAYVTFITPETYRAVMDYAVQWEAEVGRKPTGGDPIFKKKGKLPGGLSKESISTVIRKAALSAGVWVRHPDNPRLGKTPASNGFRRFFNKTLKDTVSRESPVAVLTKIEFMMGHKGFLQLDPNYYKTNPQELASLYVNAIPNLTINEPERPEQADRRDEAAMPELGRPDDRIRLLDEMDRTECLGLLEGMLAYGRNKKFAGSANSA